MDVLAATWSRCNVSTLRSPAITDNVLGQCFSTGLENTRESLREVLLNWPGECTGKVLGKFFSTGLENVQGKS